MARLSLTPRLRARVDYYGLSHRAPGNKALHYFGIPLLAIAAFGIFSKLALTFDGDTLIPMPVGGWIGIVVAFSWYAYLDWRMAIPTTAGLVLCFAVGHLLPLTPLIACIAVAVVVHMYGHFGIEGKAPSTLSDPMSIMDAPLWLMATWLGCMPAKVMEESAASSKAA